MMAMNSQHSENSIHRYRQDAEISKRNPASKKKQRSPVPALFRAR